MHAQTHSYKICSKCLKSLHISKFNRCGYQRDGITIRYRPECKQCTYSARIIYDKKRRIRKRFLAGKSPWIDRTTGYKRKIHYNKVHWGNHIDWWIIFVALWKSKDEISQLVAIYFRQWFWEKLLRQSKQVKGLMASPPEGVRIYKRIYEKLHKTEKDRNRRNRSKTNHIMRKRNAFISNVNSKEIFMRDGWKCQICGGMVLKRAVVPHPMAPTIDHIIPLAEGGTHEPKNVQCAHFICNSKKRDKAVNDQLRIF